MSFSTTSLNNVFFMTTFRTKIDERQISVKEIHGITGIPVTTIYKYLSGVQRPTVDYAILIARALGMTVEEVFPVPEQMPLEENLTAV